MSYNSQVVVCIFVCAQRTLRSVRFFLCQIQGVLRRPDVLRGGAVSGSSTCGHGPWYEFYFRSTVKRTVAVVLPPTSRGKLSTRVSSIRRGRFGVSCFTVSPLTLDSPTLRVSGREFLPPYPLHASDKCSLPSGDDRSVYLLRTAAPVETKGPVPISPNRHRRPYSDTLPVPSPR